jgi:acyl carrier protein
MTANDAVTSGVLEYFEEKAAANGRTFDPNADDALSCAYLDDGLIDSFGLIEMIMHFETAFGMRLDGDEMQEDEFRTVGGLINIISAKV